jgi:hypothetical protein
MARCSFCRGEPDHTPTFSEIGTVPVYTVGLKQAEIRSIQHYQHTEKPSDPA